MYGGLSGWLVGERLDGKDERWLDKKFCRYCDGVVRGGMDRRMSERLNGGIGIKERIEKSAKS